MGPFVGGRMDCRRRPLRGRDFVSLGRKTPRCNFVEIREELRSIQVDLIALEKRRSPLLFSKAAAINYCSDDQKR